MELLVLLVIVLLLAAVAVALLGLAVQIAWALLVGAVVGGIAAFLVGLFAPGREGPQGCLPTALAGIAGSLLATLALGQHGFVADVAGAMVVVLIWKSYALTRYPRRR